ncbi:hypothetical protein C8R45DRAFT_1223947 [Mycena sanguinolenta]|nr:hypothetical protein C8R45DRAFT_1223947 [Mycena sanguinolenta]
MISVRYHASEHPIFLSDHWSPFVCDPPFTIPRPTDLIRPSKLPGLRLVFILFGALTNDARSIPRSDCLRASPAFRLSDLSILACFFQILIYEFRVLPLRVVVSMRSRVGDEVKEYGPAWPVPELPERRLTWKSIGVYAACGARATLWAWEIDDDENVNLPSCRLQLDCT